LLDIANKYEEKLQLLFANIAFDDKYKFLSGSSYRDKYKATDSTWSKHEFVSIHKEEIVGYLSYAIDRDSNTAWGMQIVNFKRPNIIFAKDLKKFLTDIFDKFQFRKLKFAVYVGNPIEKSYDRMCKKHGGRIVGTYIENDKLIDGNFYDCKMYEIMRTDYLNNKNKDQFDEDSWDNIF